MRRLQASDRHSGQTRSAIITDVNRRTLPSAGQALLAGSPVCPAPLSLESVFEVVLLVDQLGHELDISPKDLMVMLDTSSATVTNLVRRGLRRPRTQRSARVQVT